MIKFFQKIHLVIPTEAEESVLSILRFLDKLEMTSNLAYSYD